MLARLGDTNARIDQANLDRLARVVCVLALAGYALHAIYAMATHRALYGDAAWFLVRMISEGKVTSFYTDFSHEFYYSRFIAYALTQLPTLGALHLGVDDPRHLSWVLGATYFIHKPLSLWLCYRLLPAGRKSYVVFPLLGLFAGSINSEIYIVTETHLATSFLWPLLLAVTQLRQPGRIACSVVAAGLLLSAFVYESFAFFGPVLLLVCLIRAVIAPQGERARWGLLSAFALVPIAMSWAAILFPRDPTNKSAFSSGVMKLVHDTMAGVEPAHVLGVASILALLAFIVLLGWAWRARATQDIPWWIWAGALVLALLPAVHFMRYAASVDFTYAITDRGFGGLVMQLAVMGLYLLVLVLPARIFQAAIPGTLVVVSGLAAGQVAWQLLATHAWRGAIAQLEGKVATTEGLDRCTSVALGEAGTNQSGPARMLCHWWILPLSVVLAPDSGVRTLVVSEESFLPFDPHLPRALPNSPAGVIDYRPYLRALAWERSTTLPEVLDFTSSGNASRYLRNGFSHSENWATWTDGKNARLEFCFAPRPGDPLLTFKITPLVNSARPTLAAVVDVNGLRVADWAFHLGEAMVERQVAIPRGRLDENGCAALGFTFDDDRRASEIGVPGDPRRLGFAIVSMRARY
jgi:hypothetical protein